MIRHGKVKLFKNEVTLMIGKLNSDYCFKLALENSSTQPMPTMLLLTQLMSLPMESLLSYSDLIIKSLPLMIEKDMPRKIALMVNKLWYKLSAVMSHQ